MAKASTIRGGSRLAGAGVDRWMGAAFVLAILASVLTFDPKLYINGDNVDYMFLARDFRGGDLWPSNKYPPLFPAFLAPVQLLFGLSLIPQKILVGLFYAGSVWFLLRLVKRRWPEARGALLLWVSITLIPVVEYSHYVMSEVPYLFFLLGALDAADRILRAPGASDSFGTALRDRRLWGLALWLAASFYTRTVGLAVVGALVLLFLIAGRARFALALCAAFGVLMLPWAVRSALTPGGNPYFEQWRRVNPYYPEYGYLTPTWMWKRICENGRVYFLEEIPVTVAPIFYRSTYSGHGVRDAYYPWGISLLVLIPLAAGAIRGWLRRDVVAVAVTTLLLGSCLWPPIWASTRFLVPMVPLLYLLWYAGIESGIELLARHRPSVRAGLSILLALWAVLGVKNLALYAVETREYPPEWKNYFAALEWSRDHLPPDAVVIDRKPNFVEFVAGRESRMFPRQSDPDLMLDAFVERGATHVILPSLPYDDIFRYLEPTLKARSTEFEPLQAWTSPPTYVLRFRREAWRAARSAAPGTEHPPAETP